MPLIHPRTKAFFVHFATAYRARTVLMVALLMGGGLLEGVSVITLVPLLEIASTSTETSTVGAAMQRGLGAIGVAPTLPVLVGLVVLGITLKAIFLWLAMRQVGFTVARVTLDLRLQLVRALLRSRWSYIGSQPVGGFANSISREAVRSAMAYREACVILGGVVQVLAYLVVSALISWQVTVGALVTGALLLRGLRHFVEMGRAAGEEGMRLTRSLTARLVEALQGIKPMKAMAREDLFWPLLEGEAEGLNEADRKNVVATESIRLFQEPVVTLMLGLGLFILLTVADRSFSSIIVLAFVFYRIMTNVNSLQMHYQSMVNGESMFWSLKSQIDEATAAAEVHTGSRPVTGLHEGVELRDVTFSYGDLRVLDGINLFIPARRLTALIGPSGSGKSTILDLVIGLRRPDSGEVHIDGIPLSELDLRSWRELIGYVPQDVFLFHDSVRRNITLGDETISDDRVLRALEDAGAGEFIARHADGIDAIISPQGSNLSGGQRQRLAIARALVKDPALLILDEATTGLDAATEAAILDTLRELRGRVTILAISHQVALRNAADLTVELAEGQVVVSDAAAYSSE